MNLLRNFKKQRLTRFKKAKLALVFAPFGTALALVVVLIGTSIAVGGLSHKGQVLGTANSAYGHLNSAYESLERADLDLAGSFFAKAAGDFATVEAELEALADTLKPGKVGALDSGLRLARAGFAVSTAGKSLTQGLESLTSASYNVDGSLAFKPDKQEQSNQNLYLGGLFKNTQNSLLWSADSLKTASQELEKLELASLPPDMGKSIMSVKEKLTAAQKALNIILSFNTILADAVSADTNILLVFQNTAEARPTGGFMGSYAFIKTEGGYTTTFLTDGVYGLDEPGATVAPPEALARITSETFSFRDSNWWPHFPASAEKMRQFFELQKGEDAQIIITFTPEFFEGVLGVLGEVSLPKYNVTVNSDNFYQIVEHHTRKENALNEFLPKEFIGDLGAEMLNKMNTLESAQKLEIVSLVFKALHEKDIMFWSKVPELQSQISHLGIGGELAGLAELADTDHLLITGANISGGKTDRHIDESVKLESTVGVGGTVANKLTFLRTNRGQSEDFPENSTYLRVYTPLGSTLAKPRSDVEVYEELGRTVFASKITTRQGSSSKLVIEYVLPKNLRSFNSHKFFLERSPGQLIESFEYTLELPEEREIVHTIGTAKQFTGANSFNARFENLKSGKYMGAVFE